MITDPPHVTTEADYRSFINALLGREDEAQLSGFDLIGTKLLREAIDAFAADVNERFAQ